MFAIHELTPAPWGDHYRLVADFDTREDAESVLTALEKVNIGWKLYTIVDWNAPTNGKMFPDKAVPEIPPNEQPFE